MPGFMINGKGAGGADSGVAGNLEIRRTHRWVFEKLNDFGKSMTLILKSAQRPSVKFAEQEMFHNQERVYVAGQHEWDPIELTWYDIEQDPDVSKEIWDWFDGIEKIGVFNGFETMCVAPPKEYKGDSRLSMVDGCGKATETWTLYQGWPSAINWQGLDYTTSELQTVVVTYRFDRAVRSPGT